MKSILYDIAKLIVTWVTMLIAGSVILGVVGYLLIQLLNAIDQQVWGYSTALNIGMTTFFALISIALGIFLSKNIKKYVAQQSLRKGLTGIYCFTAIVFTLGFFGVSSMSTIFSGTEKQYQDPRDCEKLDAINLTSIMQCSGYGQFGFQNNYDYDIRAYGEANEKLCQTYKKADFSSSFMHGIKTYSEVFHLNSNDGHSCDISDPEKSWVLTECKFSIHPDITKCYQCARGLTNGNGHRYTQIGFSDDCSKGAYITLADWQGKLIEKIGNLDTP